MQSLKSNPARKDIGPKHDRAGGDNEYSSHLYREYVHRSADRLSHKIKSVAVYRLRAATSYRLQ
jgi:hypothetical protein